MAKRFGLVLTGGGARGAYEAGALSVLLPELERRGERPTVLVGTSVGAINVSYLAAAHHLPATEATAGLIERWREVTLRSVVRPILNEQLPLVALRYLGDVLSLPGIRLQSLLDAAPLADNLGRWNDWEALRRNVDGGSVDAVAVVATALQSGRAVVFCDTSNGMPTHRSHVLDYVRLNWPSNMSRPPPRFRSCFPRFASSTPIRSAAGTATVEPGSTPLSNPPLTWARPTSS